MYLVVTRVPIRSESSGLHMNRKIWFRIQGLRIKGFTGLQAATRGSGNPPRTQSSSQSFLRRQ